MAYEVLCHNQDDATYIIRRFHPVFALSLPICSTNGLAHWVFIGIPIDSLGYTSPNSITSFTFLSTSSSSTSQSASSVHSKKKTYRTLPELLVRPQHNFSATHTELGPPLGLFAAFCNSGAFDDFLYYPSDLLLASNPLSCLTLSTFIYSRSPPLDLVPECTHQTYSTFHVTPNHAGLQILLQ